MRILRRNVDHVPGAHRNVLTVDVHETLALDHIKNVIARMRVHGKATPRFEPDEIAAEVSAVRLLGAHAASAGDPDENSTTWINQRDTHSFAIIAQVRRSLPFAS